LPANCATPATRQFNATGLTLVAIDTFDETGDGATGNYYGQDTTCAGKPYSGITIFGPSFSPPDLRLANNDVIDLLGTIEEFPGPSGDGKQFYYCHSLPEASGTMSLRFDSDGPPQPTVVPLSDFNTYEGARKWLGMLVKIENLTATEDPTIKGGRYSVPVLQPGLPQAPKAEQLKIANELYDIANQGPVIAAQTSFKSITGIVTYFYSFHIVPRSPADFEQ